LVAIQHDQPVPRKVIGQVHQQVVLTAISRRKQIIPAIAIGIHQCHHKQIFVFQRTLVNFNNFKSAARVLVYGGTSFRGQNKVRPGIVVDISRSNTFADDERFEERLFCVLHQQSR